MVSKLNRNFADSMNEPKLTYACNQKGEFLYSAKYCSARDNN